MAFKFLRFTFINFLQEFIHDSRTIGIMLLVCTALSLIIANTGIGADYISFFTAEYHFFEPLHLPHSIGHWINDGLMAVFFFLVGMEIKRELVMGELSSLKRAILPIAAAIGGMVVPAFIYLIFNKGTVFAEGWGIPMATDIAFSLGVASIMGKRCPTNLKVFLTALAIIDDLGAIVVIAFFYGDSVKGYFLLTALLVVVVLVLLNKRAKKIGWMHWVLAILLWYLVFNSGIHATVAGVIFAFTIPDNCLAHLELKFHNFVNFFILPLFALANTAIIIKPEMASGLGSSLGLGIMLGLLVGKPVGIFGACWLLVRKKIAELPRGVSWNKMIGAGLLAGIGFTMSIFIVGLAFKDGEVQDTAKIAILVSALISVLLSFIWFRVFTVEAKTKAGGDMPNFRPVGIEQEEVNQQ